RLDLAFSVGARAGVVDHVVRSLRLLGDGHLARHACAGGVFGQAVARHEPGQLGVRIGCDHDHAIHARHAARLEEQRHVPDDDALERFLVEHGENALLPEADGGMRDLFEALPPCRVREDDGAQRFPVKRAVLLHDLLAELLHDLEVGRLPRHHDLAGEDIRVENARTQVGEHATHRALAGGDAASEADQEEPPHACAQSPPVLMSTLSGTSSVMADSITCRARASRRGTSVSGASNRSSSCTCSSMRAWRPLSASAWAMRTMAIFMRSAAVPWTGALVAMRSAKLRRFGLPLLSSGM